MPAIPNLRPDADADRLARLEERLARIESHLGLAGATAEAPVAPAVEPARVPPPGEEGEFEFEVGQKWFARFGILALAVGGAFMLSLPYARLPAAAPSVAGFVVAVGLFALARVWQQSFELVANYVRGAGMALLWFATLRLFFFGAQPALEIDSAGGRALLVLVTGLNFVIAFRRGSPPLATLALTTSGISAVAIGAAWPLVATIVVLAVVVAVVVRRQTWPLLWLTGTVLGPVVYFVWAIGNPVRGGAFHFMAEPRLAPAVFLGSVLVLAAGALLRGNREDESMLDGVAAALNAAFGYGVFLLHTAAAYPADFVVAHGIASVVFVGLASVFWFRNRSHAATFFYAMTGYAALSMAIIKASAMPNVFVWLSLQSVVVVATAVWFRSRFIIVANFLIYLAVVLGYVVLKERETGISIGFGIVALITARILNWQQDRLELKTELMRNAYLFSAFVIFPYALYHLVPATYVGLAWVGLALVYYALNLIVLSPKYRWMGHATLLLTAPYLVTVGTRRFEPVYRVLSFLVLGTVLLMVSLIFSWLRRRKSAKAPAAETGA